MIQETEHGRPAGVISRLGCPHKTVVNMQVKDSKASDAAQAASGAKDPPEPPAPPKEEVIKPASGETQPATEATDAAVKTEDAQRPALDLNAVPDLNDMATDGDKPQV